MRWLIGPRPKISQLAQEGVHRGQCLVVVELRTGTAEERMGLVRVKLQPTRRPRLANLVAIGSTGRLPDKRIAAILAESAEFSASGFW